ncbi:hypothetical protein E308F_00790 [Moorella sp. E308F]|nr:hypothetical protein E308F_00790 [Moorella sp. E308F]
MTDLTRSYQVAIPPTPRILIEEGDTDALTTLY